MYECLNYDSKPLTPLVQWKIDTYSAIWQGASLSHILDHYGLKKDIMNDFWTDVAPMIVNQNYGSWARYVWNFIVFEINAFEYQSFIRSQTEDSEPDEVLRHDFSMIRIYFGGQALDYLRSCHSICIEVMVMKRDLKMHPTRIDIAFDFYNYGYRLLDRLESWVRTKSNLSDSGRLCVHGHASGLGFTKKNGSSERTFYIGSPGSERFLRIYDKYLERKVKSCGRFDDVIYDPRDSENGTVLEVDSWLRVEWELKKAACCNILGKPFDGDFGAAVLKQIWSFYEIESSTTRRSAKFFSEFFDPSKYEGNLFGQTLFLYNNTKTPKQSLDDYIDKLLPSLAAYVVSEDDFLKLIYKIREYILYLETIQKDEINEQIREWRLYKFKKKLTEISPTGEINIYLDRRGNIKIPTLRSL